MVGSEIIWV